MSSVPTTSAIKPESQQLPIWVGNFSAKYLLQFLTKSKIQTT